jgi:hypothetical protein
MNIKLQFPVAAAFRGGRLFRFSPATTRHPERPLRCAYLRLSANLNNCHPERAFRAKDLHQPARQVLSANLAPPLICSLLSAIPQPLQNLHGEFPCPH